MLSPPSLTPDSTLRVVGSLALVVIALVIWNFRPQLSPPFRSRISQKHPLQGSRVGLKSPKEIKPDKDDTGWPCGRGTSFDEDTAGLMPQAPDVTVGLSSTTRFGQSRREPVRFAAQAQGFFNNSHDLVLNNPIMYHISGVKEQVLQWLSTYTMSGAEFDASVRDPPPRCHPGTRITILDTIRQWCDDAEPVFRSLWLYGPMGVGKSAIVQTLAEELWKTPRLGATLFFSRPHRCNKPAQVFATLAYQLAVRIPPYQEFLRQKMIDDPKLLEKGMEYQFNILIVEPFVDLNLAAEGGGWVILLDGLDECKGDDAQVNIIKLISGFLRRHPSAPLLWLVASRPEAHILRAFKSVEVEGTFLEQYVPANSDAASQDVEKYLRAKFEKLRDKHEDLIPRGAPWPVERDVAQIASMASGYFIVAETIIRHVDDPNVGNPVSQLISVLSVPHHTQADPLSTLYALYTSILDTVPKHALPTLRLLLGNALEYLGCVLESEADNDLTPLVTTATELGLRQDIVYAALRGLYSVVRVPSIEESSSRNIRFYHTSFADYLCDASKSGEYAINPDELCVSLWRGSLILLRDYPFKGTLPFPRFQPSWDLGTRCVGCWSIQAWFSAVTNVIHSLTPFCSAPHGRLGHDQVHLSDSELQDAFKSINFSLLPPSLGGAKLLIQFSKWLTYDAPSVLVEAHLVESVALLDLKLSQISDTLPAVKFCWTYKEDLHTPCEKEEDEPSRPGRLIQCTEPKGFSNAPRDELYWEAIHPWHGDIRPTEELRSELNELRRTDSTLRAVIVGSGPSKTCFFVFIEPKDSQMGVFYYVPYHK